MRALHYTFELKRKVTNLHTTVVHAHPRYLEPSKRRPGSEGRRKARECKSIGSDGGRKTRREKGYPDTSYMDEEQGEATNWSCYGLCIATSEKQSQLDTKRSYCMLKLLHDGGGVMGLSPSKITPKVRYPRLIGHQCEDRHRTNARCRQTCKRAVLEEFMISFHIGSGKGKGKERKGNGKGIGT